MISLVYEQTSVWTIPYFYFSQGNDFNAKFFNNEFKPCESGFSFRFDNDYFVILKKDD